MLSEEIGGEYLLQNLNNIFVQRSNDSVRDYRRSSVENHTRKLYSRERLAFITILPIVI